LSVELRLSAMLPSMRKSADMEIPEASSNSSRLQPSMARAARICLPSIMVDSFAF
jgi:hypothetical protein